MEHKVTTYFSYTVDTDSCERDCFCRNWTEAIIYALPSWTVISGLLKKIERDRATEVIIESFQNLLIHRLNFILNGKQMQCSCLFPECFSILHILKNSGVGTKYCTFLFFLFCCEDAKHPLVCRYIKGIYN